MDSSLILVLVILLALFFDFTNGFHDTANSIATMVGTRAVPPQVAVAMAATLNFVGAFWSLEVAQTIGGDIIQFPSGHIEVILAGLVGAIAWNLMTWYVGIPSSSSHALVGGLVGSAIAWGGPNAVIWHGVVQKVALPALIAPTLGLVGAFLVMGLIMRAFKNANPHRANILFKRGQIVSGAWLSFTHGTNDAQKTMGIMAVALASSTAGGGSDFSVPTWVVFSAATAMALGTYAGGWKIIKTLGSKVVKMAPSQGFAASMSAAAILQVCAHVGVPVSTTHCVSGSVMGAGASKRFSSVRWNVAGDIATAWVLTLPSAALVGMISYALVAISPLVLVGAWVAVGLAIRHMFEQRRARTLDEAFQSF
jgi:PiT family inorganic phosphate transporter